MTPQQRTALEALVGRVLTQDESDQIDALLPERRDNRIAEILSVGRTRIASRMASARGLAELFPGGPAAAEVVLLKLEGAAVSMKASADPQQKVLGSLIARQLAFLGGEGLDFGSPALRTMLDQFAVLGILTADEVAGLKAVAPSQPDPLPAGAVSDALNGV